jgi:hypothetical protein
MPLRAAARALGTNGRPSSDSVPARGRTSPLMTLIAVVFPAPLGPMSPWISPCAISS